MIHERWWTRRVGYLELAVCVLSTLLRSHLRRPAIHNQPFVSTQRSDMPLPVLLVLIVVVELADVVASPLIDMLAEKIADDIKHRSYQPK